MSANTAYCGAAGTATALPLGRGENAPLSASPDQRDAVVSFLSIGSRADASLGKVVRIPG